MKRPIGIKKNVTGRSQPKLPIGIKKYAISVRYTKNHDVALVNIRQLSRLLITQQTTHKRIYKRLKITAKASASGGRGAALLGVGKGDGAGLPGDPVGLPIPRVGLKIYTYKCKNCPRGRVSLIPLRPPPRCHSQEMQLK